MTTPDRELADVTLNTKITGSLKALLEEAADDMDLSQAWIVRKALSDYFIRNGYPKRGSQR